MTLFQSPEWEEFKLATSWQKSYRVDGVLILQKNLPMKRTMLYSPMANGSVKLKVKSEKYMRDIKKIAEENNSIFYRLEINAAVPRHSRESGNPDDGILNRVQNDDTGGGAYDLRLMTYGFKKAVMGIQPDQTRIIDLTKSEGEILAQMKQKGRYNIKVAQKHGVTVKKTDDIDAFYKLYKEMSQRQKISFRENHYFKELFDILSRKKYIGVFIASVGNKDLAGAVVTHFDDTATYLFGGSSDEMKNAMAPYLLHWEIIKNAKANGYKKYDLFGVSPEGVANHKWAGVTAFKEKFGGEYVKLMGSWDL